MVRDQQKSTSGREDPSPGRGTSKAQENRPRRRHRRLSTPLDVYDAESFAFAAGGKPCSGLDSSLFGNLLHTTSSTAEILNAHWMLSLEVSVQVQPHYCVYSARDSSHIRPIVNVRACTPGRAQSTPNFHSTNSRRDPVEDRQQPSQYFRFLTC